MSYISNDGLDLRNIAEIMTEAGIKMNHASAYNNIQHAMRKIATELAERNNIKCKSSQLDNLSKDQSFHNFVAYLMQR